MSKIKHIKKLQALYPQEAWEFQRKGYANSSEMAKVIDPSRHESLLNKDPNCTYIAKAARHGICYEKVALEFIKRYYNIDIYQVGSIRHPKYKDLIRATPDGLTMLNGEYTSIEIKCPVDPQYMQKIKKDYPVQFHTAANCAETEQIMFARFQFLEEQGKWNLNHKGFKNWKDGVAYGFFENNYRKKFKLYYSNEFCFEPNPWAVKFQLKSWDVIFLEPEDVVTPNLDAVKMYVTELRKRQKPSDKVLVDIGSYLKEFGDCSITELL